jgi:hypothetical protein
VTSTRAMLAADFITMARGRFDRARGRAIAFLRVVQAAALPGVGPALATGSLGGTLLERVPLTFRIGVGRRLLSKLHTIRPVIARVPKAPLVAFRKWWIRFGIGARQVVWQHVVADVEQIAPQPSAPASTHPTAAAGADAIPTI